MTDREVRAVYAGPTTGPRDAAAPLDEDPFDGLSVNDEAESLRILASPFLARVVVRRPDDYPPLLWSVAEAVEDRLAGRYPMVSVGPDVAVLVAGLPDDGPESLAFCGRAGHAVLAFLGYPESSLLEATLLLKSEVNSKESQEPPRHLHAI